MACGVPCVRNAFGAQKGGWACDAPPPLPPPPLLSFPSSAPLPSCLLTLNLTSSHALHTALPACFCMNTAFQVDNLPPSPPRSLNRLSWRAPLVLLRTAAPHLSPSSPSHTHTYTHTHTLPQRCRASLRWGSLPKCARRWGPTSRLPRSSS